MWSGCGEGARRLLEQLHSNCVPRETFAGGQRCGECSCLPTPTGHSYAMLIVPLWLCE